MVFFRNAQAANPGFDSFTSNLVALSLSGPNEADVLPESQ